MHCDALGGHPVSIPDAEEQRFVSNLISTLAADRQCWIGVSRANSEKQWRWSTDEPVGFANWGRCHSTEGHRFICEWEAP